MRRSAALGRFLWDFVIGDDWRIALAVAITLIVTLVLSNSGVAAWWLLPVVVPAMLSVSVWTAAGVSDGRRAHGVETAVDMDDLAGDAGGKI